jgi:hypothetical protein
MIVGSCHALLLAACSILANELLPPVGLLDSNSTTGIKFSSAVSAEGSVLRFIGYCAFAAFAVALSVALDVRILAFVDAAVEVVAQLPKAGARAFGFVAHWRTKSWCY